MIVWRICILVFVVLLTCAAASNLCFHHSGEVVLHIVFGVFNAVVAFFMACLLLISFLFDR